MAKSPNWCGTAWSTSKPACRSPATPPCWARNWQDSRFQRVRLQPRRETFLRLSTALACRVYHLSMAAPPTQSLILTFQDARRVVDDHASQVAPRTREAAGLLQSAGRILAEPITADRDIPPFPRSTRDGYAVCAADLAKLPARLKIIGEIKAGPPQLPPPLNRGEAFSIMTGAPVPPGADAVVMVEHTSQRGDSVEI